MWLAFLRPITFLIMPPKRYEKVYSSWRPVKEGQVKEQQPYFDSLDYSDITITMTVFDHVTSAWLPVISSSSFLRDDTLDSSAYSYNAGNSSFFFWNEALNCHLGERSAWYAKAQDTIYCIQIIEIDGTKWNQDFLQDMKKLTQHGLVGSDKADFEFLMAWHGFWGNSPLSTLEENVNATAIRAQRLALVAEEGRKVGIQ